jgi:ribosomal protein S18 acetylase RimI-like enzyme
MTIDRFRTAEERDAPAIAHLVNLAYRPTSSHAGWTHEADLISGDRTHVSKVQEIISAPDSTVIVAPHGTEIVACIHVEKVGNSSHLGMFAVAPAVQGNGLGKALLAFAEDFAFTSYGSESLLMHVISQRVDLLQFYLRRGYRRMGCLEPYPTSAGAGIPKVDYLEIELLEKPSTCRAQ